LIQLLVGSYGDFKQIATAATDPVGGDHRFVAGDIRLHLSGSFSGTNLDDILKKEEIDTVVIAGYMTQMCCDTTARQAFERGYRVEFLSDATGTKDVANYAGAIRAYDLHHAALLTQAMVFSRVLALQQWMEGLEG
jgi:nicotinamidase-related amidase